MRKLTTAEFIARAIAVHGDRYDYSKTIYVNNSTKVCIICPEHGEFWQLPGNHLKYNCQKCAGNYLKSKADFVTKANKKHGFGRYDYSKVEYINAHTKVCITCPEHGEFWQTPDKHTNEGTACPKCSGKVPVHPDLSHIETPPGSRAVPVGIKGDYALVDTEDYERVMGYNWHLNRGGYAKNNTVGLMHRFIMRVTDPELLVDHKYHNTLDNRKSQLRVCTKQQNQFNSKARKGTSPYKGVYWDKVRGKWIARITLNYKAKHLGMFTDEVEAAKTYDKAAKEVQGDFARLNFR